MNEQSTQAEEFDINSHLKFDAHFRNLILKYRQNPNIRMLPLQEPIPAGYPYDQFLENYFSEIPYQFHFEDFDSVVSGKEKRMHVLKYDRRPKTFISLFRFLEFFRARIKILALIYERYSDQFFEIKDNIDSINPVRNLLIGYEWTQEDFNQKSLIFECSNLQRSQLQKKSKELEEILINAEPMVTLWRYNMENLFLESRNFINENMKSGTGQGMDSFAARQGSTFNLKHPYRVKDLETLLETFAPAMIQAHSLIELLIQITRLQKTRQK